MQSEYSTAPVDWVNAVKCFQVLLFKTNNAIKHQTFVYTQLNDKTVLFQTIQFSMSTKLNGSKYCYVSLAVLFLTIQFSISQQSSVIPSITETLPSDCLVAYPRHML